jgi:hypothetical protein
MKDTFEFTLNNPLTEEDWDMISDVDFDRTDRITFHTKHGKEVEFQKVIRCRDCKFLRFTGTIWRCQNRLVMMLCEPNDFCSRAERNEE